jgi:hypothetical protein
MDSCGSADVRSKIASQWQFFYAKESYYLPKAPARDTTMARLNCKLAKCQLQICNWHFAIFLIYLLAAILSPILAGMSSSGGKVVSTRFLK